MRRILRKEVNLSNWIFGKAETVVKLLRRVTRSSLEGTIGMLRGEAQAKLRTEFNIGLVVSL